MSLLKLKHLWNLFNSSKVLVVALEKTAKLSSLAHTEPDKIKLQSNAKVDERAAQGGRGKEMGESDVKRILHSYLPGHSIPGEGEAIIGRQIHQMREL